MRTANKRTIVLLICIVSITVLPGCTNWKRKYENLNVAYKNMEGRLEFERTQKGQLTEQVSHGQQTIEELQRQIAEQQKTPAEATGFGEGYDVAFDASAGTITVTLENTILFSSGRATLKKATSAELDHIISVLKRKYRGKQIDVVGHTDSVPIKRSKWKDNWELSAQRSLSVVRYLIKRGTRKSNIRAVGRGASQPVASNSSSSGRAKNRRVEIIVYVR